MSEDAVVAQSLRRRFGSRIAVDGVDLLVRTGDILALLGPNGAGKTTTVRMIAALLRPSAGSCVVHGYDVVGQADRVRRIVGIMTDVPALYADMTLRAYLLWFAGLYNLPHATAAARTEALIETFELSEWREAPLASVSRGTQQKVALARALLHDPLVLLLDEPTAGLDVETTLALRALFRTLKEAGRAIILCTHHLAEAEKVADAVVMLVNGRGVHYQRLSADGTLPRYRVRLTGPPLSDLTALSTVPGLQPGSLHRTDEGIEYGTPSPEKTNPRVAAALIAAGMGLVELVPIRDSLEEIYLRQLQEAGVADGSADRVA